MTSTDTTATTATLDRSALFAGIAANAATPAPAPISNPAPRQHADWTQAPATDKQKDYIRSLLAERVGNEDAERVRTLLNVARDNGGITKGIASGAITVLKDVPVNPPAPKVEVVSETPKSSDRKHVEVPEGHYALADDDGVVKFYTVHQVDKGRWEGWTFVDVHASDERHALKGNTRWNTLQAIASDPAAAAVLYGHETNNCSRCGRELTREESRAAGIGPVCARKNGWA